MDRDLEGAEIVFAQKLASGEPTTRKRALKRLQAWITECSTDGKEFEKEDFLKLWKGLYYSMWMQDKMLIQEELADNMGQLINNLGTNDQVALFVETFFMTLGREWHGIDRWRLDKFLMLMRRFVRALFAWLNDRDWSRSLVEQTFAVCMRTVLSTDSSIPDGVKFHFAAVYLDELDLAGAQSLDRDQVTSMLIPFINLLADHNTSNYLFDAVIEEVFVSILHQFSDELGGNDEDEDEESSGAPADGIKFNYANIGERLFQIGKAKTMRSDRRKRLYAIVKKFNMAANGIDPMSIDPDDQDIGSDIDEEQEIEDAARRLLRREHQAKTDREQFRKDRKRAQEQVEGDSDEEQNDDENIDQKAPSSKVDHVAKGKKRQRLSNEKSSTKKRDHAAKGKQRQRLSNEKSSTKKRKPKKVVRS